MNDVLAKHSPEAKQIDYVEYIKEAIARAEKNAPVRKADVPALKRNR